MEPRTGIVPVGDWVQELWQSAGGAGLSAARIFWLASMALLRLIKASAQEQSSLSD